MMQFSLISLIPGLIRNLQDCADPELDNYVKNLEKPTSLRTSDRNSLLNYMGVPLQIFGKVRECIFLVNIPNADILQGSLFGPYTPLQQLDLLADYGTKSYIVGSTNSLLLQQKDRYSDILINLDEDTINISSVSLRSALSLSAADRRWIDFITQSVNETWDETNPGRPKTMGYVGSEEFIRLQFEEYLLSLISAVKCHNYIIQNAHNPKAMLPHVESDPAYDFGMDWIDAWSRSENYRIWEKHTDSHLFDIVEPKHPCAGGLTIDDVQRRIAEQVKEFHLDERFAVGREVIGRNFQAGREKASTVFSKLYADMEALRESQRRKHEEQKREAEANANSQPASPAYGQNGSRPTVTSKASAYIGSWGSWVGEKRKTGWGRTASGSKNRDSAPPTPTRASTEKPSAEPTPVTSMDTARPSTQESYQENIFDADVASRSKHSSLQHSAEDQSNHSPIPSKIHEIQEPPTITKAPAAAPAPAPTPVVAIAAVAPTPDPTPATAVAPAGAPAAVKAVPTPAPAVTAAPAAPAPAQAAELPPKPSAQDASTAPQPTEADSEEPQSKASEFAEAVADAVEAKTSPESPW